MFPLLVADIGGTNARFAVIVGWQGNRLQLVHQREFPCAQFKSFGDVLKTYITTIDADDLRYASIAIAGPIEQNYAKMTNLDWEFSAQMLQDSFGFQSVMFVNDLAAQALATPYLDQSQFERIKPGTGQAKSTRAIIGPGTGLGVASLHWSNDGWRAFPTEGGHVAFAPGNQIERDIYRILLGKHGYVSLEMLLSGPGMVNIYHALATIRNEPALHKESKHILQHADNPLCAQTIDVFVGALGAAAGNMALVYGAKGGVCLSGGMTTHLLPFIKRSDFVDRFLEKGFRHEYLASIPIDAILYPTPGLLGAALWYHQHSLNHEPVLE